MDDQVKSNLLLIVFFKSEAKKSEYHVDLPDNDGNEKSAVTIETHNTRHITKWKLITF